MANNKITQRDRVLQYIRENGSITAWEASKEIGCLQLSARLCELKKRGYNFAKKRIHSVNRYGDKTHYDVYRLVESE